jgi:hypothetical protein
MWRALTNKGQAIEMGQHENGIYWACLRDEFGDVESATTKFTRAEIDQWLEEHGVKSLLFEDGEQLNLATK